MKFSHVLLAAGASAALAATCAVSVSAAPAVPNTPYASGVSLKLLEPSTIYGNGAYEENVSETAPFSSSNCGFYLYRYTANYWGGWQYLGFYSGTQTNDLVQDNWGGTEYELIPTDCNGNQGAAVFSAYFYPTTLDNQFFVVNGSATTVYSSVYYGGSALQTTSRLGTRVRWYTDNLYNGGVIAGTGPQGGIANVYVDGVKKGTINFYSSHIRGMRLLFKFGTASAMYHTIDVVMANRGSGGGFAMYLDANVENKA